MIEELLKQFAGTKVDDTLRNSITQVFKNIQQEVWDVMDSIGESRDDYHISIYPFSLSRIDETPVPTELLLALQKRFQN